MNVIECRILGFLENTCRTDYIWKILEHGVIARAPSKDFNVAAVHSHRGTIDIKVSDVIDEASVCYVNK